MSVINTPDVSQCRGVYFQRFESIYSCHRLQDRGKRIRMLVLHPPDTRMAVAALQFTLERGFLSYEEIVAIDTRVRFRYVTIALMNALFLQQQRSVIREGVVVEFHPDLGAIDVFE